MPSHLLGPSPSVKSCHPLFIGLKLQGAKCTNNILALTATILTDLPLTTLEWVR